MSENMFSTLKKYIEVVHLCDVHIENFVINVNLESDTSFLEFTDDSDSEFASYSNKYDELRRCLGECSWVDKPQWFKKMLLTMIIRSLAPFHLKPFGLYVINLENFINVLKVSYSYFNLMRTLK
ncbi:uncharacterized protein LOC142331575 isoform X2 [Lycorma delicatula]|uniref:uncharacterized protein LOC142331575 isoform X2 n=1 Tax=Lycorma delicatula TaxID=130591 RepID=UPI003F513316